MTVLSHVLSPDERARSPLPRSVTRRRLDDMWLHVNFPCNLACTHCLFSCNPHYAGGIPDLTLAQACGYTLEAQAAGATTFYVTGGEPLMWRPLREFLAWYFARPDARPLVILTNGTLIGAAWARFFAPLHALGLELRVSLECYSEDINDRWRGAGAHALAMKGLRQLNAVGIKPTIAFTSKSGGAVSQADADELEGDFRTYLLAHHQVDIAGLKLLGAWEKGELAGQVDPNAAETPDDPSATQVQCMTVLAVSGLGVLPCPIVTDVPEAVLAGPLSALIGEEVELKFRYCRDCYKTGST